MQNADAPEQAGGDVVGGPVNGDAMFLCNARLGCARHRRPGYRVVTRFARVSIGISKPNKLFACVGAMRVGLEGGFDRAFNPTWTP